MMTEMMAEGLRVLAPAATESPDLGKRVFERTLCLTLTVGQRANDDLLEGVGDLGRGRRAALAVQRREAAAGKKRQRKDSRRQVSHGAIKHGAYDATILRILPGTKITFRTVLPSS